MFEVYGDDFIVVESGDGIEDSVTDNHFISAESGEDIFDIALWELLFGNASEPDGAVPSDEGVFADFIFRQLQINSVSAGIVNIFQR